MKGKIEVLLLLLAGCAHASPGKCVLKEKPAKKEEYLCNARILYMQEMYPEAVDVILRGMKKFGEEDVFLKALEKVLKKAGLEDEWDKFLKRRQIEGSQGSSER